MPIELHRIYYVKLSGECVWVEGTYDDGSYKCRRLVHTHDNGDEYRYESFAADELQDETSHNAQLDVERQAMARLLKANGISVLSDESPLSELFHTHGGDN